MASRTWKIAQSSPLDEVDPAFLQFAIWAFGKDGLPDLRVLAWGDFSYDSRWAEYNALLCRDQSLVDEVGFTFRTPLDSDTYYWDLIDDNIDMLAACPSDSMFD